MQPDQRFYRGSDRLLGGVCSGLAEGFNVDPLWVRLAFVALAFLQGIGVFLYIVLWLLMPERAPSQAAGRSALDSMTADMKRAWADLRAQFWAPRPAAPPTATSTGAAVNPPPGAAPASTPAAPPPSEPSATASPPATPVTAPPHNQYLFVGLLLVVVGFAFLAHNSGLVDWAVLWPAAVIVLGIALLVRNVERKG